VGKRQRDCTDCGAPVGYRDRLVCCRCHRRRAEQAAKTSCPGCGRQRVLQPATGRCVLCSRVCARCGHPVRAASATLCRDCRRKAEREAARRPCPRCGRGGYLRAETGWCGPCTRPRQAKDPPRVCAGCGRLRRHEALGLCSACWQRHPDRPFVRGQLLAARLAAGRRQRRIDAAPDALRPAVAAFAAWMLRARERARRAGTRPRADGTIEAALATLRDLARFLAETRGKLDWALVDVGDVEAFLATLPNGRKRRLTVLRQFFGFARRQRLVLADPTGGLSAKQPSGFTGATVDLEAQRRLFRRWMTDPDVHPHEALLGVLALLHGASSREVRLLRVDQIDPAACTIRLGQRPQPVPLDPASWTVLQRSLAHREHLRTDNPHVMVTRGTKAHRTPASTAYVSHVLDACGVPPRMLRCIRLVDLVNTMDPKLVAAAFGMDPEGVMIYLADRVHDGLLPSDDNDGVVHSPELSGRR
jgi:site-specific recombinase XerC